MPVGAATFADGAPDRRRGLPRAEGGAARARARDRRRRRGRLRAGPRIERGGDRGDPRGGRARGHRDAVAIALDPATSEVFADGAYGFEGREHATRGDARFWAGLVDALSRSSRSRTGSPRTTGRLALLTPELGDRVQLVGDDLFVTNPERLRRGIDERRANSILVKVNQIGTLTETLEAIRLAQANGYTAVDLAPLGRDGGHDDRRPRRRHERARSRPAPRPAPTASRSTTSSCGSRRSSATAPSTRAGRRSRAPAAA